MISGLLSSSSYFRQETLWSTLMMIVKNNVVVLLVKVCFMFYFCMLGIAWIAHVTMFTSSYDFRHKFTIHSSNALLHDL